jgi:hypothetical protein
VGYFESATFEQFPLLDADWPPFACPLLDLVTAVVALGDAM